MPADWPDLAAIRERAESAGWNAFDVPVLCRHLEELRRAIQTIHQHRLLADNVSDEFVAEIARLAGDTQQESQS